MHIRPHVMKQSVHVKSVHVKGQETKRGMRPSLMQVHHNAKSNFKPLILTLTAEPGSAKKVSVKKLN